MLDLLIVLLFIGWAVWTGFRTKSQASKDLGEYFLAGRSIKGWRAGLSMAATQSAADTPLLATEASSRRRASSCSGVCGSMAWRS